MLRLPIVFALGLLAGRRLSQVPPRPAAGASAGSLRREPAMMADAGGGQVAGAQTATEAVSEYRQYAERVARIASDASSALRSAQAKAHAGVIANPHDRALAEESARLSEASGALLDAFLSLYARQLAEQALDVITGSTSDLEARAAEMPAATKAAKEIQPVIAAADKVRTVIGSS